MTIEGHHLPGEAGNNTILATPTRRHTTPAITPEVHSRLLFHLNNHPIRTIPANLTVAILVTSNKDLLSTTRLIITDPLHNPTAITHLEEVIVELCPHSVNDFHKYPKRNQQEDHMC